MAVSRYIPKNIKSYKPKLFWGLTSRQLISVVVAGALICISISLLKDQSIEARIYLSAIPAIIPIAIGFVPIYGLPLEKILPEMWKDNFMNPPKRYRISPASLRLNRKKNPLKLNNKNKPLAVCKKKK